MVGQLAAGTHDLLERDELLAFLGDELDEARAGRGRFVLLAGEAGAGKTAVLRRFCDVQPTAVLWGACDPPFTPRPLGPLLDIAEQRLAALEHIVFKEAWDATHTGRPALFGVPFDFTPAPNRYGIPAFYALHAWIWKDNPAGMFMPWNPRVSCP